MMNEKDLSWELLQKSSIYESPFVSLEKHHIKKISGEEIDDFHIVDYGCGAVGCLIKNLSGKFLMIRHYRYSVDRCFWEIPAGRVEDGEDAIQAAKRELWEETGVKCEDLIEIGKSYPVIGNSSLSFTYFFGSVPVGLENLCRSNDPNEEIYGFQLFTKSELLDAIRAGEVASGLCLTAVLFAIINNYL